MIEGYIIGAGTAIVSVIVGHILHMRWLDRKLYKPYPKKAQSGGTPSLPPQGGSVIVSPKPGGTP